MNAPNSMCFEGVHYDMPLKDYLAVDAISSSDLRHAQRSMWHYRNRVETEATPSMLRGTLAHCAILEPNAMMQRYAVVPEDAPRRPSAAQWAAKKPSEDSKAAMAWWTQFNDSCTGREIVAREDYNICQMQLAAVAANPTLAERLRAGRGEVSIFWVDDVTGLYCKARPDWMRDIDDRTIAAIDIKTAVDESPNGFGRTAARLRYDLQQAHYEAGIEAVTKKRITEFVFGVVTNKPPVLAVPYVLTDEIRDQGREERRELLGRIAWCKRENEWPAYGAGLQLLDFPAYAKQSGEVEVEWSENQ